MADPITKYMSITRAYHPRLSYDGSILVFVSDTAGIPQIYEMPLSGDMSQPTWRNQITRGNERVIDCWFSPASGDTRLIYARDMGGNENIQFDLIDPAASGIVNLTAGSENARHLWGDWSADGKQILFAANRRDAALFDLYVQPIGEATRMVWQNNDSGFLGPMAFSPDGGRAIVVRAISRFEHELFEIDIDNDSLSQLTPSGERIRFAGVQFSKDGQSVYLNTDMDSDFLYIARLDLETLDLETVAEAEWDIEHMTLSPNGTLLAYTINAGGVSELQVMELSSGEVSTAPLAEDTPGVVAELDSRLTFSSASRHIAFSYSSPIRTANIHIWNLGSDQVHMITRSSHGNIEKAAFQLPKPVHYSGAGGLDIPAWLYHPGEESDDPIPAVVYVCGGPETQHRPAFNSLIQYFVAHGIAVLAPNVRGSSGYGKSHHLPDIEKRLDAVDDVSEAAHWLREQPGIDPDRVALYGEGYGGFMALAALSRYPELWAAGAVMAGMSNLVSFLENTSTYRQTYDEAEYGRLASNRAFLESISPIHQADKITAPLMIVHGVNNPYVPLSESEQIADRLKGRAIPFEYLPVDDEGIEIARRVNRRKIFGELTSFLEEHLQSG